MILLKPLNLQINSYEQKRSVFNISRRDGSLSRWISPIDRFLCWYKLEVDKLKI